MGNGFSYGPFKPLPYTPPTRDGLADQLLLLLVQVRGQRQPHDGVEVAVPAVATPNKRGPETEMRPPPTQPPGQSKAIDSGAGPPAAPVCLTAV